MHMGLRIKRLRLFVADGVALFKADNMRRMVQDTGSNNLLMKYRQYVFLVWFSDKVSQCCMSTYDQFMFG